MGVSTSCRSVSGVAYRMNHSAVAGNIARPLETQEHPGFLHREINHLRGNTLTTSRCIDPNGRVMKNVRRWKSAAQRGLPSPTKETT